MSEVRLTKTTISVNAKRDISNQRFERLVAICPVEKTRSGTKWECACDCGKTAFVLYSALNTGRQKSCGCYQWEIRQKPFGQAAANKILRHYKTSARKRDLPFNITDEVFFRLTKQPCFYCGCEPSSEYSGKSLNGGYVYNGVDRADNARGYELDNVVSCCGLCNMMKKTMSQEDFINKCKEVAKKHA